MGERNTRVDRKERDREGVKRGRET